MKSGLIETAAGGRKAGNLQSSEWSEREKAECVELWQTRHQARGGDPPLKKNEEDRRLK